MKIDQRWLLKFVQSAVAVFVIGACLSSCARYNAAHDCLTENPRSDSAVASTILFGPVGGALSGMDDERNARVHQCLVQRGVTTAGN